GPGKVRARWSGAWQLIECRPQVSLKSDALFAWSVNLARRRQTSDRFARSRISCAANYLCADRIRSSTVCMNQSCCRTSRSDMTLNLDNQGQFLLVFLSEGSIE